MRIEDDFLPEEFFKGLQYYCNKNDFRIVQAGDKFFSVLETPQEIVECIHEEGHELILSFIREAYDGFDNDLNIHADGIITTTVDDDVIHKKCAVAKVLYINNTQGVTENGTSFWKHPLHGLELPEDVTNEEFDRMLTEDANNLDLWEQTGYVKSKPNRLLTYNSNTFHSKWPKNIDHGRRVVLVAFYSKK
ncbi:DUF6445 family protein [Flavobacterium sp.]|uniref:DUF6445 family protein n=1 Tax=Flavobacterium sp. TaxID=239 RepID=UPI003D6C63A9